MKIKTLMDFLNKDSVESGSEQEVPSGNEGVSPLQEE